jgi:hypothetical protein
MTINVEENIKKARRSAYGLFSGGYHGLDPGLWVFFLKKNILIPYDTEKNILILVEEKK